MTGDHERRLPEFLTTLAPASVLQIGGRPLAVVEPADGHAEIVDGVHAATLQLSQQYELVVLASSAATHDVAERRAVLHSAVQHLLPGGHLAILHHDQHALAAHECAAAELTQVAQAVEGEVVWTLLRRSARFTVHDLVFEARRHLLRLSPEDLVEQLRSSAPPLVLDTRTPSDRDRFGVIPGSVHMPRTVLEWRADPANGYLHPSIHSFDQTLVVVCNHGYSSSLAAANLTRVGYPAACDLVGGVSAWAAAGFPLEPPDHTFLEL